MRRPAILAVIFCLAAAAAAAEISREDLKAALKKNPEVLIEALKDNRKALFEVVSQAAQEEQEHRQKEQELAAQKEVEDAIKNPLKPEIGAKTRIRGNKDAKITLIEYSDFQCPYCARGFRTVEELRKRHGKDLRFIYKHMPLSFHPEAMPAARWLEAVALQSPEKSWAFHDKLFENQDKLGEAYYKQVVKELGLDVEKAEKDSKSDAVAQKIEADINEAKKFGMSGTPGFLVNGVPVRGAYPLEHFEDIIAKVHGDAPSGGR